jgi:hypothetical protein
MNSPVGKVMTLGLYSDDTPSGKRTCPAATSISPLFGDGHLVDLPTEIVAHLLRAA